MSNRPALGALRNRSLTCSPVKIEGIGRPTNPVGTA
jgi:hypothetical protein